MIPPSGPTTTSTSPAAGMPCPARAAVASSCSTRARALFLMRSTSSRWPTGCATSGTRLRRDCLAAALTTLSHLRSALAPRSPRHTTTLRDACHGTTSSTPSSVADSMAWSSRSALASACTSTKRSAGSGSCSTAVTSRPSSALPAEATDAVTLVPWPSESSTDSPGPILRTVAACRPSGPSSRTLLPTRTPARRAGSTRKSGSVTAYAFGDRVGYLALNASRSLPSRPWPAGARCPSGRSSPRKTAS